MQKLLLISLFFLFSCIKIHAQNSIKENTPSDYSQFVEQPGFVKNFGQFTDERNDVAKNVLYGSHIGDCGIFITDHGISYINSKIKGKKADYNANASRAKDTTTSYIYNIERIDISLKNARINSLDVEEIINSENTVNYNYYTSSKKEGVTGIHPLKEVILKNVYPEIDWSIQFIRNQDGKPVIKYNFIVRPGGDVSKISLRYSKNVTLQINETGDLLAKTALGNFTEKAPVSYFENDHDPVLVKYKLSGQNIGFECEKKQFKKTLVIDPEVFWGTFLPALQPDVIYTAVAGNDIAADPNNNIMVLLSTLGSVPFMTANPGNGAYYQDYVVNQRSAMLMLKFTAGGRLLWSTYFSGKGQTEGLLMTVDKNGNTFALGMLTYSQNSINVGNGDIPLKNNGGYFSNAELSTNFITKFDNNGALLWSTFYAMYETSPSAITTDDFGNLYVAGSSKLSGFPIVDPGNGAYMGSQHISDFRSFIIQFDVNCNMVWSTRIEEGAGGSPRMAVDKKGNIFIAADNSSTTYPLLDAGGYFNTSVWGIGITRFNKNRKITWSTGFPGPYSMGDIDIDEDGNLYLANGWGNLTKFNEKTQLVWTRQYPQAQSYSYRKLKYDPKNKVLYVLGIMNDVYYNMPTKNTVCNGSFFFNGKNPKFYNVTGPLFITYTVDGDLQYASLADWAPEYHFVTNMDVDKNGDILYIFGHNVYNNIPDVKDPGNGAYFTTKVNLYGQTPFIMKLKPSELQVTSSFTPSSTCDSNNIINLSIVCGNAPFRYQWSNGDTTSKVKLSAGNYSVVITDNNFLTKVLNFNVPNPPVAVKSFQGKVIDVHCDQQNGSLVISNISGGTSPYTFSVNNQPFTSITTYKGIDSGKYIVAVKDANGCSVTDSFSVGYVAGPSASHMSITPSSCNKDDGIVLVDKVIGGVAPYFYSINNSSYTTDNVFKNLPAATTLISVKDAAGCTYNTSAIVTKYSAADSIHLAITPDHCLSGIGVLTIDKIYGDNQPFTLSLDNVSYTAGQNFGNLKSGSYTIYVKDDKSCILKNEVTIGNVPGPEKIHFTTFDAVCGATQGSVQIDSITKGTSPYTFSLTGANYQSNTVFNNVSSGTHALTVKDNFGCSISEAVSIKYIRQYGIDIAPHDTVVCYGQNVPLKLLLENQESVKTISWSTGEKKQTTSISPLFNTPVYATVVDKNGCTITDTSFIQVKACNPISRCVGVPSAFTPNSDGYNDEIGPIVNGCLIKSIVFQIYNRWGQLVFETTSVDKKWNGKFNNKEQPTGTYVFVCSYYSDDNNFFKQQGVLELIR